MMKFGDILRELLEQHSMTQKQLADILGITASALGNYIHNKREPDFATLLKIAGYFDVSADYLLNHPMESVLSHDEELLLHIFRSLNPQQQEFYLEQGRIFLRQNKKTICHPSPGQKTSLKTS